MESIDGGDAVQVSRAMEATIDEVGAVCKQAFPFDVDPGELAVVRKQFYGANAMDPGDDTLGGTMIALPAQGEPITALRAATVVMQAGARGVPLPPQGSIVYPTSTGDATLQWLGLNAAITESTVPTGALSLTAKKAAGLVKLPNEFIRFSQGVAEAMIRESLIAKVVDLAALEGTGGSGQPEGLLNARLSAANTPTVGSVTMYTGAGVSTTLGNTFRPEDALRMIAMIEEANDQDDPTAFLMRPLMWAGLANKRADASMLVASVGVMELALSTDADFGNDQTWVRIIGHSDVGLAHPESFTTYDNLLIPT